ncbi:nuclear transport factor 2 family protein [Flavobacterium saccharophilum]|uniref:SnoaL-like domain-containing protein n=1 Tax=Flavobacterium saccharophilum TaxID=29534 RepID=A0A1M7M799_9FLAO|nr:nuclear transport factor 2 family protein [Flavobacterium saccharophilum]SHM86587.1 SnoaL-like domain-containing protein [Flavobacterium saccharophilum]
MRKLLTLMVAVFIIISCNNQKQSKVIDTSKNEKIIKQYFEYFNSHNWKKMAEMYTESADFKDPSLGKGIVKQTRKQTEDKYAELNEIFPDLHDKIIQIYPSGENHIVVEFISTGTAPDNSKLELPICTIFTIENGLITKDFTYFDNFQADTTKK